MTPPESDERPPILGSWANLYWALVLCLVLECALFWALERWAS